MLGSIKLGRLFGIDIRVHWTFFILLLLVPFGLNLLVLAILLPSVLLHELGHSLVAKRFGIHVLDITFWPLGGMARMAEIPEEPRVEGLVAIAGPAVNFALVGLAVVPAVAAALVGAAEAVVLPLGLFAGLNLVMGVFNLVPAFPMDGGRILRAFLARRHDYVTATEMAVRAGRVVALGMILVSVVLALTVDLLLCFLPVIALFVWFAGGRELMAVRMRHGQSPFGGFRAGGEPQPAAETASPGLGSSAQRPETRQRRHGAGFTDEEIREMERFRGRLDGSPRPDPERK
ncbi:MAG: site-2 protease family protein [Planctomycetota bacterium]|nr:site-2 protease family protein [Planctomycetota bacterium]